MARILICDDAAFIRMIIKDALVSAGHEVIGEAADTETAVKLYKEFKPDVVTMDLLMKTPGKEAIREIKKFNSKAKIIIISILTEQESEVIEAVRSGAEGIVIKPIKREALLAEVERVLNKK